MEKYDRWGSGLATVAFLRTGPAQWKVSIHGDGCVYSDTFVSSGGAAKWAEDVLVAYFGWTMNMAQEYVNEERNRSERGSE